MKVMLTQRPVVSDAVAFVVSATNDFLLLARFRKAQPIVHNNIKEDGSVEELIEEIPESEGVEDFVKSLTQKGLTSNGFASQGFYIRGARVGLPDELWELNGCSVLDFDTDSYGVGERSAHAMWLLDCGSRSLPINAYSETYLSKTRLKTAQRRRRRDANLYLPFSSTSPCGDEATLQLFVSNVNLVSFVALPVGSTIEQVTTTDFFNRQTNGEVFPDLTISAPTTAYSSNGIEATVTCSWRNGGDVPDGEEVFIETSAGYISKQRVKLVNGQARIKFIPLGLESGDVAKIQVGFRLFTGLDETEIEVA